MKATNVIRQGSALELRISSNGEAVQIRRGIPETVHKCANRVRLICPSSPLACNPDIKI